MKGRVLRSLAGAAALACLALPSLRPPGAAAAEITEEGPSSLRSYIVVLRDGSDVNRAAESSSSFHGFQVTHLYRHALRGYAALMSDTTAAAIAEQEEVDWVQLDRLTEAAGQRVPTGVQRVGADRSPIANIDGSDDRIAVDVAVLDTGIDLDHPDLNVRADRGKDCTVGTDAPVSLPLWQADDAHGHGTHVAGSIGALDNKRGVVGVAPGTRLWPIKVLLDTGRGLESMLLCGIDYVTAHAGELELANLSLVLEGANDGNCGRTSGDALHKAICRSKGSGVTFVVAAGNAHRDTADFVPASYDEVITVSALADFDGRDGGLIRRSCYPDRDDTFADFSNFGSEVDVIAPGTCIRSTQADGSYGVLSGTSMAAAHVTGIAALFHSQHPGATSAQVKKSLLGNGEDDWTWPSQDEDGIRERRAHAPS